MPFCSAITGKSASPLTTTIGGGGVAPMGTTTGMTPGMTSGTTTTGLTQPVNEREVAGLARMYHLQYPFKVKK